MPTLLKMQFCWHLLKNNYAHQSKMMRFYTNEITLSSLCNLFALGSLVLFIYLGQTLHSAFFSVLIGPCLVYAPIPMTWTQSSSPYRFYTAVECATQRSDLCESELAKELHNGRLFRLITKLSTIVDRPQWEGDVWYWENGAGVRALVGCWNPLGIQIGWLRYRGIRENGTTPGPAAAMGKELLLSLDTDRINLWLSVRKLAVVA